MEVETKRGKDYCLRNTRLKVKTKSLKILNKSLIKLTN